MSKLLYSATMSLDGFIAGVDGDMSWMSELVSDPDLEAGDLMAQIGALLIGNRTYGGDDPNAGTDSEGAFGGEWQGRSILLTHDTDRSVPDPNTTLVGDLSTAVTMAKEAAGDRYVCVLGADVARQLMEAGLLDEVLVFIAPVLLGDGVRLFAHPGGTNVRLERFEPAGESGSSGLWYRVVR